MNKDLSKASIKSLHHQIVFFFLLTSYSSKCKLNCMISVWSTAHIIRVNTEGSQKFFCAQNLRIQSDILPELFCDFRSRFNAKIFSYPRQRMESALLSFPSLVWFQFCRQKKKMPWFRESNEILDGFISTDSYLIQPCLRSKLIWFQMNVVFAVCANNSVFRFVNKLLWIVITRSPMLTLSLLNACKILICFFLV